jgi:hypothetical protein
MGVGGSPQVAAMGAWLVGLARDLLDSEYPPPPTDTFTNVHGNAHIQSLPASHSVATATTLQAEPSRWWAAGFGRQRMSPSQRFEYFVDLVCKLRLWKDRNGKLFDELKGIVQVSPSTASAPPCPCGSYQL